MKYIFGLFLSLLFLCPSMSWAYVALRVVVKDAVTNSRIEGAEIRAWVSTEDAELNNLFTDANGEVVVKRSDFDNEYIRESDTYNVQVDIHVTNVPGGYYIDDAVKYTYFESGLVGERPEPVEFNLYKYIRFLVKDKNGNLINSVQVKCNDGVSCTTYGDDGCMIQNRGAATSSGEIECTFQSENYESFTDKFRYGDGPVTIVLQEAQPIESQLDNSGVQAETADSFVVENVADGQQGVDEDKAADGGQDVGEPDALDAEGATGIESAENTVVAERAEIAENAATGVVKPADSATQPPVGDNVVSDGVVGTEITAEATTDADEAGATVEESSVGVETKEAPERKRGECEPTNADHVWDAKWKRGKCVITKCATGYEPNEDGSDCEPMMVLSKEDSEARINDLKDVYDEAHKNETSIANKTLGAASMAATGAGGMMLATGITEQKADKEAEEKMRGYVATFKCNYGNTNVEYGTQPTELPISTELYNLYAEYVTLANDLKLRKEMLGLRAGIESEKILDSATTGLYDDVSSGRSAGMYTSLARAILDPNGADATAWAEQTKKSKDLVIAGATTAGTGAIGGVTADLLMNKDAPNLKSVRKDISDIDAEYADDKQLWSGE